MKTKSIRLVLLHNGVLSRIIEGPIEGDLSKLRAPYVYCSPKPDH